MQDTTYPVGPCLAYSGNEITPNQIQRNTNTNTKPCNAIQTDTIPNDEITHNVQTNTNTK